MTDRVRDYAHDGLSFAILDGGPIDGDPASRYLLVEYGALLTRVLCDPGGRKPSEGDDLAV